MQQKIKKWLYSRLRKSEKYFKLDMVYLAQNSFWLFLGQICSFVASFGLSLALANFLPKNIYGEYKYLLSLLGILTIFSLPGINGALVQAIAREKDKTIFPAFRARLQGGVLGSLLALAGGAYYASQGNFFLSSGLLLIALCFPLLTASQVYVSFLVGKKKFKNLSLFNVSKNITTAILLASAAFFFPNALFLAAVYLVTNTIFNVGFFLTTQKKINPRSEIDKSVVSYGRHMSVAGVIGSIASYLDNILIFHYLGAVELAIYAFALAPVNQIKGLFKNIAPLVAPKLAKKSVAEINCSMANRLKKLFFLSAGLTAIYWLAAPFIYHYLFPRYQQAIFYSQLFALSLMLRPLIQYLNSATQAKVTLLPKSWIYWGIVPNTIYIFLLFWLIKYKILGIILARLFLVTAAFLVTFARWHYLNKKMASSSL